LDDDEIPEVGDLVHGYVVDTNKKGCFLRLSRKVGGRVILKELCDGFLPSPSASFPMGRLVVGKVKSVKDGEQKGSKAQVNAWSKVVDLDMRESMLVSAPDKLTFEDIEVGQKYKGTVSRIEDYGVFVKVHNSDVSGLVHKSECSDNFIKSLTDLYDPGDLVKILVLKKDAAKNQLGFSMKSSHFVDDEDSDDSSVGHASEDGEEESVEGDVKVPVDEDLDSEDENLVAKLAARLNRGESPTAIEGIGSGSDKSDTDSSGSDSSDDNDSVDDHKDEEESGDRKGDAMDTDIGFDWGGIPATSKSEKSDRLDEEESHSSSDDDDDNDDPHESSRKSRRKQAQRMREDQEIARREIALADGTADSNPETASDFERLLAANPDESEIWIKVC